MTDRPGVRELKKLDICIALVLTLGILLLSVLRLEPNTYWGDDSAAYILEGIAIAEGELDTQAEINAYIHPSTLPQEAAGGRLVYVWGYPLILSAVYKAVGFDRYDFSSVIYYHLPTAIAFALFAGVFYMLLRRHCGRVASVLAVFVFCLCPLARYINGLLYSDTVFLFWQTGAVYVGELFAEEVTQQRPRQRGLWLAVLLGLCMFFTYETRLNGICACLAVLAIQLASLLKAVKERGKRLCRAELMLNAAPYLLFAVLCIVFEKLVFAPATSNLSDFSRASLPVMLANIREQLGEFSVFLSEAIPSKAAGVPMWLFLVFVLIGLIRLLPETAPHAALTAVTIIGIITLPYSQTLRYYYPIIPFIIMYAAAGAEKLFSALYAQKQPYRAAVAAVLCLVAALNLRSQIKHMPELTLPMVISGSYQPLEATPYSSDAIDMYRYIMENTPEDCIIKFFKPRMLLLNTGRMSFADSNGLHSFSDADYLLIYEAYGERTPENIRLRTVYGNGEFTLYELIR